MKKVIIARMKVLEKGRKEACARWRAAKKSLGTTTVDEIAQLLLATADHNRQIEVIGSALYELDQLLVEVENG